MRIKVVSILIFLALCSTAQAQSTGLAGFDLRLFRPPADGSGILNLHGSETLGPWKFRLGMVTEASHGLLGATNPTTGQSIRVVDDLVVSNLQGAVGLTKFLQVDLNLPVAFHEKGTNFNTAQGFKTASVGDLSLDLKFNLLKDADWRPGVSVISNTSFPIGDTGKFTGYRTVGEEVKLAVDKKLGPVYVVANGGYRAIGRTRVADLDMDDMMTFGGGVAWTLPLAKRSIDLMGEVDGATVLQTSRELTTPVEWLVGVRARLPRGLVVRAGGGQGITNGVGGGEWRVVAGLHWTASMKKVEKEKEAILLETIYFRFDKDRFLPKYEPRLKAVAEKIKKEPKLRLKVRGHTDSEGTERYNLDLSRRRTEGVWRSLIKQGVSAKKISVEAVGAKEPVSENRTAKGKSENRLVEILEVR